MAKLRLEKYQLSQLAENPILYHEISQQLINLENEFFYVLNQDFRFKLRHDEEGDYFAFFRHLANHQSENVFTLLFRHQNQIVGCCQIIFQIKGNDVFAYFCDLKVQKAYRQRALKQLAWYIIRDTFLNQNNSLLNYYCALQNSIQHAPIIDIKLYFVNMGGAAIHTNGLVRICRNFSILFQYMKFLLKQKVSLHIHIKRGYIASTNSADLHHTQASKKKLLILNQNLEFIGKLDLHHANATRIIQDNPNIDYSQTVLMGLSETPTNQAFTLFLTHQNGENIPITQILAHSGMI